MKYLHNINIMLFTSNLLLVLKQKNKMKTLIKYFFLIIVISSSLWGADFPIGALVSKTPSIQRIQKYLHTSDILEAVDLGRREGTKTAIEQGIMAYLRTHNDLWPAEILLKKAEQFCWNLPGLSLNSIRSLFSSSDALNWDDFSSFCSPYMADGEHAGHMQHRMIALLPVFLAYPTLQSQRAFITFCDHYLTEMNPCDKPLHMISLLPIFQALLTPNGQKDFRTFCTPYLTAEKTIYLWPYCMENLLPIFQAYPTNELRQPFMAFCKPYLMGDESFNPHRMNKLFPIFQAYPTNESRKKFLTFCAPYLVEAEALYRPFCIAELLPVFQTFSTPQSQQAFIDFCHLCLAKMHPFNTTTCMAKLLPIFQALSPENRQNFIAFCNPYLVGMKEYDKPSCMAKFLPVFKALSTPRSRQDFTEFCKPYFVEAISQPRNIYLSSLFPIFQVFPTSESREPFMTFCGPYLIGLRPENHPFRMEYLFPLFQALKSEESAKNFNSFVSLNKGFIREFTVVTSFLPRTYLKYMRLVAAFDADRNIPTVAALVQDLYKQDLNKTDLNAQLPEFWCKDAPPDIKARIAFASERAKQIFDRIHREDTGEVRKVREYHLAQDTEPELWELYQAYYDDLYRRTKTSDGSYRLDENILTRDNHGNLVKAHGADGTPRPPAAVEIVYHQAEFQVLELAFTELMRREFEEQRGLVY